MAVMDYIYRLSDKELLRELAKFRQAASDWAQPSVFAQYDGFYARGERNHRERVLPQRTRLIEAECRRRGLSS